MEALQQALAEKRFGDAVEMLVAHRQHVTFVEISDLLEPYMPVRGDRGFGPPEHQNIIMWAGGTTELYNVVGELMRAERIFAHPTTSMVYALDGQLPDLPVATNTHHKKPHWLPVIFCTYRNAAVERARKRQAKAAAAHA